MKIAVCFSGQLRSWRECYQSWLVLFEDLKNCPKFSDVEIDVFIHLWNFNTIPPHKWTIIDGVREEMLNVYSGVGISEIKEFIDVMSPKKYIIEDFKKSSSREKFLNDRSENIGNSDGGVISWAAPQLYSIMRSGQLKRDYEIENNFEYDICIKMRYDSKFLDHNKNLLLNEIPYPLSKRTIYSMHSINIDEFPYELIGDIFFYSDSQTYDVLTSLYFWTPTFKNYIFPKTVRIEGVFFIFNKNV
jgi:hypothetical protein